MNVQELKELFVNAFKQNRKTPKILIIDNEEYTWNGGQRIGNSTLFKYRNTKDINDINRIPNEKQIMISNETLCKLENTMVGV